MTKKRKGSVLLHTLVMCIVLSYIAVALTRWGMSRYLTVNNTYTGSATTMESSAGVNVYLSKISPDETIPCATKTYNASQNAFKYSVKCKTTGQVKRYEFKLTADGTASTKSPFE